ncbi:MAG: hypothetical protein VXZ24_01680, partial [Pseudomonadota bacterium]|nr:hypothetical protein [Pseudomonadota bacterium]
RNWKKKSPALLARAREGVINGENLLFFGPVFKKNCYSLPHLHSKVILWPLHFKKNLLFFGPSILKKTCYSLARLYKDFILWPVCKKILFFGPF